MKRYPEYKDSGIEWIGEIPINWIILKLKFLVDGVFTGTTPKTANKDYFENGKFDWFTPVDFNSDELSNSERKLNQSAFDDDEISFFKKNSIFLVGICATIGKVGILYNNASCNQQINIITFNKAKLLPKYGYYLTKIIGYEIINWASFTTLPIFNQTKNLEYIIPTLSEQTTIANFLDHKTQQIDNLIGKKERLIELLKEERTAIINQAVTKGLDPNVPMKDSCIEWLGDIPEHWEVGRLKHHNKVIMGQSPNSDDYTDDPNALPFLQGNAEFGLLFPTPVLNCNTANKQAEINDILLSVRAPVGAINIANTSYGIGRGLAAIRSREKYKFNYYYLHAIKDYLDSLAAGSTFTAISVDDVKNIPYPSLPITEYNLIVEFLDNKTSLIDGQINLCKKEIELFTEYKISLINEAVTGKIDLRDFKINYATN